MWYYRQPTNAAQRLRLSFTNPTPERKYIKILQYVAKNPNCTIHQIALGCGFEERNYGAAGIKMVGHEMITALHQNDFMKVKKGFHNANLYTISAKGRKLLKSIA